MNPCEGYACPPDNSYHLFLPDLAPQLAVTGMDDTLMTGGIITAVLFMLSGGILFAYNHQRNKERKGDD